MLEIVFRRTERSIFDELTLGATRIHIVNFIEGTSRPEEITFHLLHLSVMRDYIHHEFHNLRYHIRIVCVSQEINYLKKH